MKKIFAIMVAGAMLASCSKDAAEFSDIPAGYGELSISTEVAPLVDAETRAQVELPAGTTIPSDAMQLNLSIVSTDAAHSYNNSWNAVSDYSPKKDLLFATTYDVTIHTPSLDGVASSEEGIDKPYFEGTTSVTVVARTQTPVEVKASLANSIVRIAFTDNFKGYFPNGAEFKLTTAAGNEFKIGYTADDHSVAELYWFVRPTSFTINGVATKQRPSASVEPQSVTFAETINSAVAPRTLYTYTFDVKGVSSTGEVTITLNDTPIATEESDHEMNDDAIL